MTRATLMTTASVLAVLSADISAAAVVTYSSAVFDNTNLVSTNGTLIEAYNLGHGGTSGDFNTGVATTAIVMNGVTFASAPGDGGGQLVFSTGPKPEGIRDLGGGNDYRSTTWHNPLTNPVTGLSEADANALFDSVEFGDSVNNSLGQFTDLTIGQAYEFQLLAVRSGNAATGTYRYGYAENTGDTTEVYGSPINASSPIIVTGTFVATETVQDIHVAHGNSNNFEVNAFQIRAVPEPGSLALLGLGGLTMLRRRRR
ncbi:MAG: PEP-CTERM sorting domain-containing protein [Phycisphaerales bacterium JB063]